MVDEIITLFWEDLHSSFLHRLVLASLDTSLFWKVKDLDLNVQCLRSFSVSKHPFQEDLPYTIMCAYIPKSVYYISNFCWMHFVNNPQTSTIFHVWSNLFWLLIFAKVWLAIICCDGIWIWPRTHQPSSGSVSTDPWHQEPLPDHDDPPAPALAWVSLSGCDWPQSLLCAAHRRQEPDTSLSSVSGPEPCSGNSVSTENTSWFCFVSIDCQ